MIKLNQHEIDLLTVIAEDRELLYNVARLAIENTLIDLRDSRISTFRRNGLVIHEKDGSESGNIRMGSEDAVRIGIFAIINHLSQ